MSGRWLSACSVSSFAQNPNWSLPTVHAIYKSFFFLRKTWVWTISRAKSLWFRPKPGKLVRSLQLFNDREGHFFFASSTIKFRYSSVVVVFALNTLNSYLWVYLWLQRSEHLAITFSASEQEWVSVIVFNRNIVFDMNVYWAYGKIVVSELFKQLRLNLENFFPLPLLVHEYLFLR